MILRAAICQLSYSAHWASASDRAPAVEYQLLNLIKGILYEDTHGIRAPVQSPTGTQSPFDGTWIIDSESTQLPQKPTVFLLAKRMFGTVGQQIKADGTDQKVRDI